MEKIKTFFKNNWYPMLYFCVASLWGWRAFTYEEPWFYCIVYLVFLTSGVIIGQHMWKDLYFRNDKRHMEFRKKQDDYIASLEKYSGLGNSDEDPDLL